MASIIIQSDNAADMELIAALAKKIGVNVNPVTDDQSEDLALGAIINKVKTGKSVSRDAIMQALRK